MFPLLISFHLGVICWYFFVLFASVKDSNQNCLVCVALRPAFHSISLRNRSVTKAKMFSQIVQYKALT